MGHSDICCWDFWKPIWQHQISYFWLPLFKMYILLTDMATPFVWGEFMVSNVHRISFDWHIFTNCILNFFQKLSIHNTSISILLWKKLIKNISFLKNKSFHSYCISYMNHQPMIGLLPYISSYFIQHRKTYIWNKYVCP